MTMMMTMMIMMMTLVMLQECHHNILQYEFPSAGLCLSTVFAIMEEACRDLPIDDYSISQNTLDNVRLWLSVCLSVCLSVMLSGVLSVSISVYLSVILNGVLSCSCTNNCSHYHNSTTGSCSGNIPLLLSKKLTGSWLSYYITLH